MEKLYRILKDHPKCKISLTYNTDDNNLCMLVTLSDSHSVAGLTTDNIRTVFNVKENLGILVIVPIDIIDGKGVERVVCELQWAVEELEELKKS